MKNVVKTRQKGYSWQEMDVLNSKTDTSDFDVKRFIKMSVNNY